MGRRAHHQVFHRVSVLVEYENSLRLVRACLDVHVFPGAGVLVLDGSSGRQRTIAVDFSVGTAFSGSQDTLIRTAGVPAIRSFAVELAINIYARRHPTNTCFVGAAAAMTTIPRPPNCAIHPRCQPFSLGR